MTAIAAPQRPDIEARVYRKVSLKVLPILMIGMFVSYIDRANLGVIAGPLSMDLGLTAASFGLAAGFFYIGYLLFEIPSNMLMSKVGARVWLARIMISWGVVTIAMAFMQNEATLFIMRFLLGLAEAGYSPGTVLFLALWCPTRLLPKALSLLNLAVPVALAIGSVVTSSILLMDGIAGIAGWRWVFVIEGIPAVILAVVIFFVLPSSPAKATWLDADEKAYIVEHVTQSANADAHHLKQIPNALRRGSLWAFALTYFCILIGFWSITYFLPTIVREQFQLDVVGAGFVSAIPWLISAVVMFLIVRSVSRTGERRLHLTLPLVAAAIGLLVGVLSGNPYLSLLGISLAAAGFFAVLSTFQATVAQVYAGALAAVSIALVNSVGNTSGLVGPYVLGYLTDVTGSTSAGLLVMSGFFAIAAVLTYALIGWADRHTGGLEGTTLTDAAAARH
ncbi:MFS transporter [Rathayibacter caricis]|uniref:MFS transporter n=1 Tax=Rathayibacter caricis TaxID=110936 RepID=UPI001FB3B567|nr:MFS transporter [Rathayibacter caricis]MCJ1697786.1 MFS transporter [Rathayibacter caricis]